jgi:LacI family transcriptional regulator
MEGFKTTRQRGDEGLSRSQKEPMVTIKQVAKESGFSSTTVSIVLNNAPLARYIPPATKTKIEATAKRLGYRPNLFARSLRSNRSHTVGVMVFDMTDPYCTLILRGIETSLYQQAYLPMLTDAQNERSRFERYLEMLLGRRVEGLIVLANWLFTDINVLSDLQKNSIPAVLIGRELDSEKMSSVITDNERGGWMALEHLYSLGHRKIAYIRGPKTLWDSAPRWNGVRRFAQEKHLEIDPKLVLDLSESREAMSGFDGGFQMMQDLLKKKRKFTAVLAFDDMSALGAIRALLQAGVKVPEECSVIGFDDVPPSVICTPALTTIRQPMEMMGAQAVNIVLEAIEAVREGREPVAQHRKLSPQLIVRDSTARLNITNGA